MSESIEQMRLMDWARSWEDEIPELHWLFHPPNGGWRAISTARKLKRMGVKAGVPDLFLAVPRGGYHGLWIEMKFGKNKPTKKQREWIDGQRAMGYRVDVCYSFIEAKAAIMEYLEAV